MIRVNVIFISTFFSIILTFSNYGNTTLPHPLGDNSSETSLWVKTLNCRYQSGDRHISIEADQWHRDRTEMLKTAFRIVNNPGHPNVVLARLGIIYQKDENAPYLFNSYNLPYYFLSGFKQERLGPNAQDKMKALERLGIQNLEALGVLYDKPIFIRTALDELSQRNDDQRTYYRNELLNIYSVSHPLNSAMHVKSGLSRVCNKHTELTNIPFDETSNGLASRFYHSEQSLFMILQSIFNNQSKIAFQQLNQGILSNSIIHKFVLNIASCLDVCFDCSDTAFRQSEAIRSFTETLQNSCFEANYDITTHEPSTFVTVSSIYEKFYDDVFDFDSTRGAQSNYDDTVHNNGNILQNQGFLTDDVLNVNRFNFYIAQRRLE